MYEDNRWVIHGLWPQYSSSSYPSYCKEVAFDPKLLEPIREQLHKNWYSNTNDDDAFWEHEWKKHGSCCFTDLDEFEYFNTTLELFAKVTEKIIEKYSQGDKLLIPVDLNFNIMY